MPNLLYVVDMAASRKMQLDLTRTMIYSSTVDVKRSKTQKAQNWFPASNAAISNSYSNSTSAILRRCSRAFRSERDAASYLHQQLKNMGSKPFISRLPCLVDDLHDVSLDEVVHTCKASHLGYAELLDHVLIAFVACLRRLQIDHLHCCID